MTLLCGNEGKEAWNRTYNVFQMRDALRNAMEMIFRIQKQRLMDEAPANSLNGAF